MLGRLHDIISKVEELHSMGNHTKELDKISNKLGGYINESQSGYKQMANKMRIFLEKTTDVELNSFQL